MKKVTISTKYITLGQFLKFIGIINSGSEAKWFLKSKYVYVNDQLETRRGRKLYKDDLIKIEDQIYKIQE